MSRPLVAASLSFACVLALMLGPGGSALADREGDNTTVPPPPPVVTAAVSTPDGTVPGSPATTVAIPCTWIPTSATAEHADALNTIYDVIAVIINAVVGGTFVVQVTFYSEDGVLHRFDEETGRYEFHVVADCTGATHPGGWSTGDSDWWVSSDPDPAILLPGATREATKPITLPVPDISPGTEGVVNLGMWFAVEPAGPISVEARLGPTVWARTTATMAETTFDPGNGDPPVRCDGHGTPIPESELDSIEAGPCGYTYPAAVEGGAITITSTWWVTWELSDGRTGREADIVVSTVVPYDVVEIQTVGTG